MGSSTYYIAYHYCVGHIPAATIPASRLSDILGRMHQGCPLTEHSLNYLQQQSLPGLYRLAASQITYEAYISALDPAFVARQQVAKAEQQAKDAQRLARETEYLPSKVMNRDDREARRKRERDATEAVLRAQKLRQAECAAQRERNREILAAAYEARTNDPDYIASTTIDIASYFHLNHLPSAVLPPLSDILDALFRGHQLTQDSLGFLSREAPSDLSRFAHGQITFDTYTTTAEVAEVAETARKARAEAVEAARIARESDPDYILMMQSKALCGKYGITSINQTLLPQMTNILRMIDSGNRLPEKDFVWLTTAAKHYFTGQLRTAYHQKEAEFYVSEYFRTKDPWSAVSASSHYRKCDQPRAALELLDGLVANRLKHPKIQSAVCTTRGGVMRDLGRRPEALQLGEQAHELQPQNFRPCTLLGAVHMEMGSLGIGRDWYAKAAARGASENSIDAELRSIFQRADKASREAMKTFLLAEDPDRYGWLNDKRYLGASVGKKS